MRRGMLAAGLSLALCACLSAANLSGGEEPPEAGAPAPACTADLQNDVGNCGACGKVCGNHANAYGTCKAGACAIGCNTGFGDCDGKIETGCESTLASDSNHCGACGHSCGGARCIGGQCQPFLLAELPGSVSLIAADATHIYYSYDGGGGTYAIGRIPKDGSAPHTNVVTGLAKYPVALAVNATTLFWAHGSVVAPAAPDGQLFRAPKTGGTAGASWLSGLRTIGFLELADTNAFFNTMDGTTRISTIGRIGVGGTVAVDNTTGIKGEVSALHVEGSFVYFYATGDYTANGAGSGLFRCPTSGCAASPTPVPSLPANTYVSELNSVGGLLYFAAGSRSIVSMKPSGESYKVLVSTDDAYGSIRSLGVDGERLFWIENVYGGGGPLGEDISVWTCAIANCSDGRQKLGVRGRPIRLLVDDKAAYILVYAPSATGSSNQILKVLK